MMVMPREIAHHEAVIELFAIGLIPELLDTHENHYKYELDLELIVYRPYLGRQAVGPYAKLVYESGRISKS